MELKNYIRILVRKWWIILLLLSVTLVSTYIFTNSQTLIYEVSTTSVMRPRTSTTSIGDDEVVRAVDTLSRRVEINTTYAEVAKSKLIKQKAIETLNLSPEDSEGLSVFSSVIAGTNVLEITVQGPNPEIVRDFANTVSNETRTYISDLYDIFELEPLDHAEVPRRAINSNVTINLAVGAVLGLILGIVVAFLIEYLLEPELEPISFFNIIDNESGAYNEFYLKLRLRQEMSRARRNNYSLSLALMDVSCSGILGDTTITRLPEEPLRRLMAVVATGLREEDIVARIDDTTFGLLLFDMTGPSAKLLLEELRIKMETKPLKMSGTDSKLNVRVVAGVVDYEDHNIEMNELVARAGYALKNAESVTFGAVNLFSKGNNNSQMVQQNGHEHNKVDLPQQKR